jgi:hypothetical protein
MGLPLATMAGAWYPTGGAGLPGGSAPRDDPGHPLSANGEFDPRVPTPPPGPRRWWQRFGRRNLLYIAFLLLLVPFGIALEASGPGGPDRGGGVGAAVMIGALGSVAFFLVNAVLAIIALARGRPAETAMIACALPLALVVFMFLLETLTVS